MSIFLPMLGVVVTILAGWAMIRRYQTHIVLLFSGLILVAPPRFSRCRYPAERRETLRFRGV